MTLATKLARTLASSWLSVAATAGTQLAMIPLALHAMPKEDFALFAIISQVVTFIMLAEMGARSASSRFLVDGLVEGEESYRRIWTTSIVVFLMQATLMTVIVLGAAPLLGAWFEIPDDKISHVQAVFVTVGLVRVVGYFFSIFSAALFADQRLDEVNLVTFAGTMVLFFSFWWGIKHFSGLWAYGFSMALSMVTISGALFVLARRRGLVKKFEFKLFKMSELKRLLRFGWDICLFSLFGAVMANAVLLISGSMLSLHETAMLAVNLKIITTLTQVLQRIPGSASPFLMKLAAEEKHEQFNRGWKLLTKSTLLAAVYGAGIFVVTSKVFIGEWAGDDLVLSPLLTGLLALIPFRYLLHYQLVGSLAFYKEIKKVSWWLVWELALYGVIAYFLSKNFGMGGLLSASLICLLGGSALAGGKWMARLMEVKNSSLLIFIARSVLPLLIAFSSLVFLVIKFQPEGILNAIIGCLLWSVVIAVVALVAVVDQEELTKLKSIIQKLLKLKQAAKA